MNDTELFDLINRVNVLCRDDGSRFLPGESPKVGVIKELLKDTGYQLTEGDLFLLYHKNRLEDLDDNAILISSHIDTQKHITKCFTAYTKSGKKLKGTFDNSITNAAVISLMVEGRLPDNVIIAFTGDEERESRGAEEVVKTLTDAGVGFRCIVLDVTHEGWKDKADFTIENNFWSHETGKKVIEAVSKFDMKWKFVPSYLDHIPDYVPEENLIHDEAACDESWRYDEVGIECFSLCIPVKGKMHSDEGVKVRWKGFLRYVECINNLIV